LITLCSARSAPGWSLEHPLSIAIQDEKSEHALRVFMPTWPMVGGWKRGQGDTRDWCAKYKPLTTAQYIDAYRALMLERKVEIVRWIRANQYKSHALYCYCAPVPSPSIYDINDLSGEVWFCHRLLVYHLLRRWFSMEVTLI
jgi:hypothetical protein